ncbi:MAG: ornithine carbamoyltransferase [Acidobacteriota bacterium]
MTEHFLSLADHPGERLQWLLGVAAEVKSDPGRFRDRLQGRALGMIFQKPSTRTRISFEVGIAQLGGRGLFLSSLDLQLGRGETIADTAKVLSRYLDCVMARVFDQADLEELARGGSIPVINGLSDLLHPCQVLADYFTLRECFGGLQGVRLAYVGDGNNMAHSLLLGGPLFGVDVAVATPVEDAPDADIVERARAAAAAAGTRIEVDTDPAAAVADADAVYTDTWVSMGQESGRAKRLARFSGFQVDSSLMAGAKPGAKFMHCLPAHRGEEVTDEVIDSPASLVWEEAENRLHAQKALMLFLMGAVKSDG